MKRYLPALVSMMILILGVGSAHAIPALQLYIEGAEYDANTETWVYSSGGDFKLWVLGDVGSVGDIEQVKLVAAVPTGETGTINLTGTTTSMVTDPSAPANLDFGDATFYSNTVPVTGDGSQLSPHGIYPSDFYQWNIGDFSLTDSPIGDYTQGGCPGLGCTWPSTGQINVYTVSYTGFSEIHFDAFDHYVSGNDSKVNYTFAPYSHDAEVPEPNMLLLVGSGLLGLGLMGRRFIG